MNRKATAGITTGTPRGSPARSGRVEFEDAEDRDPVESILRTLRVKAKDRGVKPAKIVHLCEGLDRHGEGYVSIDDFEDVVRDVFGEGSLTRRELHHVSKFCSLDAGAKFMSYERIYELFDGKKPTAGSRGAGRDGEHEIWRDGEQSDALTGSRPGSIGEWLHKAACPAEVTNFEKFIACLETFERESGMKIKPSGDGFVVSLGPDLRASIGFFVANS